MLAVVRQNYNSVIDQLERFVADYRPFIVTVFLLLLLDIAFFSSMLYLIPSGGDDLLLWSVVSRTSNPLSFFVGDWGLGFNFYRPLHMVSLWSVYQVYGIGSFQNQLINLILHFVNVFLVFRILLRIRSNYAQAFLLSCLVMISWYTISPAIWISDRPALFVALAFLLFSQHVLFREPAQLRIPFLASLMIFALLSKESGIILPLLGMIVAFESGMALQKRIGLLSVSAVLLAAYFGLRFVLFHQLTANYAPDGYLLGAYYYLSSSELPPLLQIAAIVENVVKSVVAIFLPAFDSFGRIWPRRALISYMPFVILTVAPVLASIGRKLTRIQKYALIVIVLNAIVHFALFNYRTLYIAQIAFCLFVMSAEIPQLRIKHWLTIVCVSGLLLYNTFNISEYLAFVAYDQQVQLDRLAEGPSGLEFYDRLDPNIVQRILARYRR